MRIDIATLFPDMVMAVLGESIIGRAAQEGKVEIHAHNIRDYTADRHRRVDDYPYGGGMGMVMQPQPIYDCHRAVCEELSGGQRPWTVYLSPQGRVMDQALVRSYQQHQNLFLLCGHYEGVDQRVLDEIVDEEVSLGDFVLTGGEIAAMALVDAVVRLQPGVLADDSCFEEESHWNGLLEYPQYTRPLVWNGREVPAVLLSGHHQNIVDFRRRGALQNTLKKRPDMLDSAPLTDSDRAHLRQLAEDAGGKER
ncbi:tRNA (guanosine(37)-N1)-methyltransferase TrmD [Neobittarella massiliensis]|uniref:tRNA (guanine-N(1)-)-methyltransferase n=1 Tax=Neobittarella massiliensis (ex Bilen et al. 2018) TaxID=2041842 RepID=A0A8J6IR31_9FIRM|nr:tRNA (guanosine(37)-N1)-methyltransferase TrmD [Neobittarella massiliensis]MBC3517041.1 tRNA (guanosine(37)-N1)-methyltransferase TrmD [Neobittarella massiliensis]